MRYLLVTLIIVFFNSCVPLSVTPKIEDYKVKKAHKFKRKLPKQNAFIFYDSKNADEFYQFIDAKFGFKNQTLDGYIPFEIKNETYFLSFYEVEKYSYTLNLVPVLIDLERNSNDKDPLLDDFYTSRKGKWYVVITIANQNSTDCLNSNYKNQKKVVSFLKGLKDEYLATQNYTEMLLKQ